MHMTEQQERLFMAALIIIDGSVRELERSLRIRHWARQGMTIAATVDSGSVGSLQHHGEAALACLRAAGCGLR